MLSISDEPPYNWSVDGRRQEYGRNFGPGKNLINFFGVKMKNRRDLMGTK